MFRALEVQCYMTFIYSWLERTTLYYELHGNWILLLQILSQNSLYSI